jgi:putative lipoprotein
LIVALLIAPQAADAEDKWFGADKAKHFGAGAGIAAGGYGIAVPLTDETRWRIVLGTSAGLGASAAKELRDRRRGTPSWRDFNWGAAGTAVGVLVAWLIDR